MLVLQLAAARIAKLRRIKLFDKKHCSNCKGERDLLGRCTEIDSELCDDCYFELVDEVRRKQSTKNGI